MKHVVIILLFLSTLSYFKEASFKPKPKKYLSISLSPQNMKSGLYKAIITGDKSALSKDFIRQCKTLGLLHLFTPSGLHLSSLFFINWLNPIPKFLILLSILGFLQGYAYHSMSRVLVFKIINFLPFQIEYTFIFALITALPLGHLENPLSLLYSGLFWGTLIYYRSNPLKAVFYLSFNNLILNSFWGIETNPLIFILNPLITFIATTIFPFLFLNSLLPASLELHLDGFLILIKDFISLVDTKTSFLLLGPSAIELIIILAAIKFYLGRRWIFLLASLLPLTAGETELRNPELKAYVNLAPYREVVRTSKRKIHFIDRKCDRKLKCHLNKIDFGGANI